MFSFLHGQEMEEKLVETEAAPPAAGQQHQPVLGQRPSGVRQQTSRLRGTEHLSHYQETGMGGAWGGARGGIMNN